MKSKDILIGVLLVLVLTIIFIMPLGTLGLLIPSILFSGLAGGLYIGYKRKRPIISCLYDGIFFGFIAGFFQAIITIPILWFYHDQGGYNGSSPLKFIFILILVCIIFNGLVGGPSGGLIMGLFYHYIRKNQGEMELYDSYIKKKIEDL